MPGRDLPPPDHPFTVEAMFRRWPMAARRAELLDGVLVFDGEFDERDVETALRTFPGRRVAVHPDGPLLVGPADGVGVDRLLAVPPR
jgi:hypothetical protein